MVISRYILLITLLVNLFDCVAIAQAFPKEYFSSQFDSLLYNSTPNDTQLFLDKWFEVANQTQDSISALEVVYRRYGDFYFDSGRYQAAKSAYLNSLAYGLLEKDTSQFTRLLCSISAACNQLGNYQIALQYIQIALNNAEKDDPNLAFLYNNAGMNYHNLFELEKATFYYQKSMEVLSKSEDNYAKAQVLICLGNIDYDSGNYYTAIQYYKDALELAGDEEKMSWLKTATLINIGYIHSYHNDFSQASTHYEYARTLAIKYGYNDLLMSSLISINSNKLAQQDTTEIFQNLEKQLFLAESLGDNLSLLEGLNQKIEVLLFLEQKKEAAIVAENTVKLAESQEDLYFKALSYANFGFVKLNQVKFDEAHNYCLKAKKINDLNESEDLSKYIYDCLIKVAENQKDYQTAYTYLRAYKEINDSLLNAESIRKINSLVVQQEYDEKILVNKLHSEEDQRLIEIKLTQQRKIQILFIALLLMSILIIVMLYRTVRNNKLYVHQLERLNLTLQKKRQEVLTVNQKIDQFAHSASHDIINRLNNVTLAGRLVNKNELSSLQSFRSQTLNNLENLIIYCRDLLNWSDHSLDNLKDVAKLDEILQNVLSEYEPLIKQNNVKVFASKLPTVRLSPVVAEQVLVNLIDNAVKYSKNAQPNPQIKISVTLQGNHWVVQVADNGLGIPKLKLTSIFKRTMDNHGLFFVKQNLKSYNYQIWATNNSGGGASFFFTVGILPSDSELA